MSASLPRREQRPSSLSLSNEELGAPGFPGTGLLYVQLYLLVLSVRGSVKENHGSDSLGKHSVLGGAA